MGVALLAALALLLALGAAPAAGLPRQRGGMPPAGQEGASTPPQLLLIHGGSFLVNDPTFQPLTEPAAIAAGFVPHYLSYPLDDMPAAVQAATAEARRLREQYGAENVYAYGWSAGGTLASLLSGNGLVAAAVAKAPVSDLVDWEWPLSRYGANYFRGIGLSLAARYRLSPMRRPQKSPLLIYQGREDNVVPPAMNEVFAQRYRRVHLWLVPGGHTTDRYRPYLITRAMHWLATVAALRR
jgi:pimeloyl-ACP methyl ester carboxylesterase